MRLALFVYVNLDPMPGAFESPESALANIRGILEHHIGHYEPAVDLAPGELQPEDPERISVVVYLNSDPSADSDNVKHVALTSVRTVLRNTILHYKPVVSYARRELQPNFDGITP